MLKELHVDLISQNGHVYNMKDLARRKPSVRVNRILDTQVGTVFSYSTRSLNFS